MGLLPSSMRRSVSRISSTVSPLGIAKGLSSMVSLLEEGGSVWEGVSACFQRGPHGIKRRSRLG